MKKKDIRQQQYALTPKQKFMQALTGDINPSRSIFLFYCITIPLVIIIVILFLCMYFSWGSFARPSARLTINNALSAKNFTVIAVDSKGKERYSLSYSNGVYYRIDSKALTVWSYIDDNSVKYCRDFVDDRDTQTALGELQNVEPYIAPAEELGEEYYLLYRAISVDKSTIQWMGDVKTFGDLNLDYINFYGAPIELPNSNFTCVVSYELKALKLSTIEVVCTYSNGLTAIPARNYKFNISNINKTNFDFNFKS